MPGDANLFSLLFCVKQDNVWKLGDELDISTAEPSHN